MDWSSRKEKELKEVVEQQKEQLGRYEKKLRDVVQAYKGIQKEKEALEASLSALTRIPASEEESPDASTSSSTVPTEEGDCKESGSQDDSKSNPAEGTSKDQEALVKQLKTQIATLSASLSTISAEKSRSEANFQQDRKRLLQEKDDLEKSLAAACSQADSNSQSLKQQLSELKSSLSLEKAERGRESANNQVILRELQKTIAEERQKREALETESNSKSNRLSQASATSNQLEIAERRLRDMSNELEATKMKLRASEQKLEQPSPHLVQLQNEMADLKVQHRLAIQQEQRNAAEAKEAARQLDAAHEKRVASLEARLAEFSERIGTYDRLRQQDLATVSKLKEQLNSMQKESVGSSLQSSTTLAEEEYDVGQLIDKMMVLKARLMEVGRQSSTQFNIASLLELDKRNLSGVDQHETCQLEIQQLKQELDWYKQREDKRSGKESDSAGPRRPSPTEEEVSQLRVQIQFLRSEAEHTEKEQKESLRTVQESWMKERVEWKEELAQTERSWRARVADLEQQLQKQRERSLTLLQEKDDELNTLRESLNMRKTPASLSSPTRATSTRRSTTDDDADEWPESLAQLGSMTLGASASGGQILHYVEELARKEVEIQNLRRSKHQLEATVREMQMAAVTMEYKVAEQKRHLHEEIGRLERNQSREGTNLEYLKNISLEFFLRSDPASQSHMFNAIAACLHFSPKEIQRVRQQHPKWKQVNPCSPPVNPPAQHS
uniref:EOG090X04IO n=1 Tax=Alona affinis TaxID=381656 RepID=A0A9N6WRW6_9CRUS|nr:EOG090X04IO [Alona affinis]